MTTLTDIQATLRDINPYYVSMLTWKQHDNIITATPQKPLSELAFNTIKRGFRRFGGKYVSWRGKSWFELILLEENQAPSRPDLSTRPRESDVSRCEPVLKQMEVQVASLCRAGQQLLRDCHDCAYEWADACSESHRHLPSGQPVCLCCVRNPSVWGAGFDNFVCVGEVIDELAEAKAAWRRELKQ